MFKKNCILFLLVFIICCSFTLMADVYTNTDTIHSIVKNVMENQNSVNSNFSNEKSPAALILKSMTTSEILFQVEQYIAGEKSLAELEITKENHAQFLAAAKFADLTIPAENQKQSTFQIRYTALMKSDSVMSSPYFSTIINAFSIPPADEQDPFLLNVLDNEHPDLVNSPDFENRRLKLYQFVLGNLNLHPEFSKILKEVATVFGDNIESLQSILSPPRVVLYSGMSGAGKSTALKKDFPTIDLDTSIPATDNFIKLLSSKFNNNFSNAQLFFLGVALRREFDSAIKNKYPTPSMIMERWLVKAQDVPAAFNHSVPIEVKDFDGDFRLLAIRAILRARSPEGRSTFPWENMTKGFVQSRQCHSLIFASLKEKDSYQLQYSYNDGSIKIYSLEEAKNLEVLNLSKEILEKEIDSVSQSLITKDDIAQFGNILLEFEGLTVSEAFELAQLPAPQKSSPRRFTILFTGDTHSHLEKTQQIAHTILMEKQNPKNGDVIVADVADMLTGTEYFEISKGSLELEMMNLAGYQIATLGNHEFDHSWSHLKEVLNSAKFDIVSANIYDGETGKTIAEPYKIYSLGSLNVAFVGIMSEDAWKSIRPSAKRELVFRDPDVVLDELLPQLEPTVDAIILLSHSGIMNDRQLAAKHVQIDAILGGHSHTYMNEPEVVQVLGQDKQIPIFHAFKNGEFLGKFTMEVGEKKKRHYSQLIKIDSSQESQTLSPEEEQIKNKLLTVSEGLKEIFSTIIALCVKPLNKKDIAEYVAPLGRDFISYILKESTQADAAFYPTGGIKTGLEEGPITLGTIIQLMPHSDRLLTYQVRGAWLRQLMEDGEQRWASRNRTFQYNGIEINRSTYEVTINGNALQDDVMYRVSAPYFFFERELLDSSGKILEKYENLVNSHYEEYHDETRQAIINWLKTHGLSPYIQKYNEVSQAA